MPQQTHSMFTEQMYGESFYLKLKWQINNILPEYIKQYGIDPETDTDIILKW